MPQITRKKTAFPNTEPWEDFLDLSRWRVPVASVVQKRLLENSLLFSGNYLWMWLVLSVAWGLAFAWRVLAAFLVIGAGWKAAKTLYINACLVENKDGRLANSKRREKDTSLPSSAMMWLVLFAVFVLYELSALIPLFVSLVGALLIAGAHALFRPVVNEIYFVHQAAHAKSVAEQKRPSIHSDGFEDKAGEDSDELTFTQVDVSSSSDESSNNLRNRGSANNHLSAIRESQNTKNLSM